MRHQKDRRAPQATAMFPFGENAMPRDERRKTGERRMGSLNAEEERQLMLSEMPSPTWRKPR